jgi:hypothetical protein
MSIRLCNRLHPCGSYILPAANRPHRTKSSRARREPRRVARDDKRWLWRRAVTPPVTDSNNAGRSTTEPIRQDIARTRNRRRARLLRSPTACYSINAARGRVGRATRGFPLAAETCAPPARPRSHQGLDPHTTLVSCSRMLHFYSKAEPDRRLRGCSKMRHVPRRGTRRPRSDGRGPPAAVGPCARAHAGTEHTRVCGQIHTRRSVTGCARP